jgi:uncharacterized protein (TIGR04255 family)
MEGKKLKFAPLKEVVFELFWELPNDATGFPVDPDFDIALGTFASRISDQLPVHRRLFPPGVSLKIYPKLTNQFWRGQLEWPVVQLGPGMMAVNDTEKNYTWNSYRNQIHQAIDFLTLSYKEALKFNKVTLKYVDSVDIDDSRVDINSYISTNFKTGIVNNFPLPGTLKGVNINQVFALDDGTSLSLNIQSAINNMNAKQALVWVTSTEKNGHLKVEDMLLWLDNVHTICSNIFKELLNPEFYASFDK